MEKWKVIIKMNIFIYYYQGKKRRGNKKAIDPVLS